MSVHLQLTIAGIWTEDEANLHISIFEMGAISQALHAVKTVCLGIMLRFVSMSKSGTVSLS